MIDLSQHFQRNHRHRKKYFQWHNSWRDFPPDTSQEAELAEQLFFWCSSWKYRTCRSIRYIIESHIDSVNHNLSSHSQSIQQFVWYIMEQRSIKIVRKRKNEWYTPRFYLQFRSPEKCHPLRKLFWKLNKVSHWKSEKPH